MAAGANGLPVNDETALTTLAAFWDPPAVPVDDPVGPERLLLRVAKAWGRPIYHVVNPPSPALSAAWSHWLSPRDRSDVPPREWPLLALLRAGARTDLELAGWAVGQGSKALWQRIVECTSPEEIARWSTVLLPGPRSTFLLNTVIVENRGDVAALLLQAGLDPNGMETGSGLTPLHAAKTPHEVKELLDHGADPSRKDGQGRTPAERWALPNAALPSSNAAGMLGVMEAERPDAATGRHARLFHMIRATTREMPWSSIRGVGWEEAVSASPPVTASDEGFAWGMLALVGRTLSSANVLNRRQDLLEKILKQNTPASLRTHQSIPGCDDLIFAAIKSTAYELRSEGERRLGAALRATYPSDVVFTNALLDGLAAWSRAFTEPGASATPPALTAWQTRRTIASMLPMSSLLRVWRFQFADGAFPGWWQRVPTERQTELVQWMVTANESSQKMQISAHREIAPALVALWDRAAVQEDRAALRAWAPAMLSWLTHAPNGGASGSLTPTKSAIRDRLLRSAGPDLELGKAAAFVAKAAQAAPEPMVQAMIAEVVLAGAFQENAPPPSHPRPRI